MPCCVRMLKIAIYGLGTVGQGVIKILRTMDLEVEIAAVFDRSRQKKQAILQGIFATDNVETVLKRDDIDLHIELLGGIELPLYIVRSAIDKGKNVITANKALLAEHGYTLFNLASRTNSKIGFEASIAGAIPVIRNLETVFRGQKITRLEGILNGTTNYILTRMRQESKPYTEILSDAQNLGLAEADPTLDVSGMDATHKLAILSSLILNEWIDYRRIQTRGIEQIELNDILYAQKMGYRIRLVGQCEVRDGLKHVILEPMMISSRHFLWDIEMENNAVSLETEFAGPHLFVGKGAGQNPTAWSVISDIQRQLTPNLPNFAEKPWQYGIPDDAGNIQSPFYVRALVKDEPGVLAKIAGIFARHKISIATVHQDNPHNASQSDGKTADLIIVTHTAKRSELLKSVEEITSLDEVSAPPVFISVIEPEN